MRRIILIAAIIFSFPFIVYAETHTFNGSLSENSPVNWHNVTTSNDGNLEIALTRDTTLGTGTIYVYDGDNTTLINTTSTTVITGLRTGTYNFKVSWSLGSGNYTLTVSETPSPYTNDAEPNDDTTQAIYTTLAQSMTGHLGYSWGGNGNVPDDVDWWQIDLPSDGNLVFAVDKATTLGVTVSLYSGDQTSLIQTNATSSVTGLRAGTYYVKAARTTGYGGYTLTPAHTPDAVTNDAEPNDTAATAGNGNFPTAISGHLGYSWMGTGDVPDDVDWWQIALPSDGNLVFVVDKATTLGVTISLYDGDQSSLIQTNATSLVTGLRAGTYYVNAARTTGYGGYTLTATHTAQPAANDTEPNDTGPVAVLTERTGTVTGHLGYNWGGTGDNPDITDFWKMDIPRTGDLTIDITRDTSLGMSNPTVFAHDLSTSLFSGMSGTVTNVPAGAIYIKFDRSSGTGAYTMTTSFAISNTAPTIEGNPTLSINEDLAYNFTPVADDTDVGDTLTFSITNKPAWANFDTTTGILSGTPGNDDVGTTNNIVIIVTDSIGDSASLPAFAIEVINVNDPPSITGTPGNVINEGATYSFTPTANDIDVGDVVVFSIANKPAWLTFDTTTGTLTGTAGGTDIGTTSGIVISATDGTLSAQLPAFDLSVMGSASISSKVTIDIAGHDDLPVTNATVSIVGTSYSAMTDSNGDFSFFGIPSGTYTVNITAPDIGTFSQSVVLAAGEVLSLTPIPLAVESGAYTAEELHQAVLAERSKYDPNGDGKVGLEEALNALQVVAGVRPEITHLNNSIVGSWGSGYMDGQYLSLTFYPNGYYIVYHNGVEYGTYTHDNSSGEITVNVLQDDNGQYGLADSGTPYQDTLIVTGDTLNVYQGGELDASFERVK